MRSASARAPVTRPPSISLAALILGIVLAAPASAGPAPSNASGAKLEPALARLIQSQPDSPVVAWVYFTDRSGAELDPVAFDKVKSSWPARVFERRSSRGTKHGVQVSDLPVHAAYVHALEARGARVRGASRWLNAVSVTMPGKLAADVARLPFVARVERVAVGAPRREKDYFVGAPEEVSGPGWNVNAVTAVPGDTAYYGGGFRQLSMMQVPQLHASGIDGSGVLVCVLDTGFRLDHQVFAGIDVIAKRDFIHGDTNVDYDPVQDLTSQPTHGTLILGTMAGDLPGTFVGGAYGATYALGKTENVASETPVEMDFWQFGAEWADSLGADVISSSLGYSTFDDTLDSYSYDDMDGRTTVVTLAAVEAISRGITVLTALGNEGAVPWHYLIAPSDADTLIGVGAVDSFNVVTSFSSRGPTADGRIKPDVTAMGSRVLTCSPTTNNTYTRASGTSLSTPLAGVVAALLLQAHPTWGPYEVRVAMRSSALNSANPDTVIGWGLIQAVAANTWNGTTDVSPSPALAGRIALSVGPNPIQGGAEAHIRLSVPAATHVSVDVIDLAGRREARLLDGVVQGTQEIRWSGAAADGRRLPAGVYWVRAAARGAEPTVARVVLLP
jgi:serine protease AprX